VLQLGVGSLPERVLAKLGHLKHLGLHTGILGEGVRKLIESGAVDNSTKGVKAGVSVATMALGSTGFYTFLHDNAAIEMHPCAMTHDASVLHAVGNLHAINSALQIDIVGRVNAEWAGSRRVSLPGGLSDFARAAAMQPRGRSIIALRSVDRHGASNIVSHLRTDVPCSLDSQHVDFFVTELGIASMRGHSATQRRLALAAISHPNHRDTLLRACQAM
jgi:acyl-CoA hydrolase